MSHSSARQIFFKSLWLKTKNSFPFIFLLEKGLLTTLLQATISSPAGLRLLWIAYRYVVPPNETAKLLFRFFRPTGDTASLHLHTHFRASIHRTLFLVPRSWYASLHRKCFKINIIQDIPERLRSIYACLVLPFLSICRIILRCALRYCLCDIYPTGNFSGRCGF
jgi:hypothetical protein